MQSEIVIAGGPRGLLEEQSECFGGNKAFGISEVGMLQSEQAQDQISVAAFVGDSFGQPLCEG